MKGNGIAGLDGKIILEPLFESIYFPDPVSGMTRAKIWLSELNKTVEGYVNQEGVMTIMLPPKK